MGVTSVGYISFRKILAKDIEGVYWGNGEGEISGECIGGIFWGRYLGEFVGAICFMVEQVTTSGYNLSTTFTKYLHNFTYIYKG